MIYDRDKDAFYEQQPFASWTLNSTTCLWEALRDLPAISTVMVKIINGMNLLHLGRK